MYVAVLNRRNEIVFELKAVVKGDINGDGIANGQDWIQLKGGRIEIIKLSAEQFEAADLNYDDIIDFIDLKLLLLHKIEVPEYDLNYKK